MLVWKLASQITPQWGPPSDRPSTVAEASTENGNPGLRQVGLGDRGAEGAGLGLVARQLGPGGRKGGRRAWRARDRRESNRAAFERRAQLRPELQVFAGRVLCIRRRQSAIRGDHRWAGAQHLAPRARRN